MRQITVFTGTGVGGPIIQEQEPKRQIRRVLKAADEFFKSNGLWPPEDRHLQSSDGWLFDLNQAVELRRELDRLKTLL